MIITLDTSTPVCRLTVIGNDSSHEYTWEAGRELSRGLLGYIESTLQGHGATWADLTGLIIFKGPGSFTGLRIGASVMNALAYARELPIVGTAGEDWREIGQRRLTAGENDQMVLPDYGADANITTPRK